MLERVATTGGFAVHAQHRHLRELCDQRFLQPLGALALRLQVGGAASGAGDWQALTVVAVVADQLAPARVQGQRAIAARAPGMPAAGVAQQHRRVAAAVAEYQRLLPARHRLRHRPQQRWRHAMLQPLRTHVDDLHLRWPGRAGPGTQVQGAVAVRFSVRQRFQ